ncbi:MAG: DUF2283 domain-containing protein [Candidatus Hydrothermarchaeales archaeon]
MTKIKYWKDVDVLNIDLKEGDYEYSEEVADGIVLDIDKDGEILSIEILNATKRMDAPLIQKLSDKYAAVKA